MSELCARLADICDQTLGELGSGPVRIELSEIRSRLSEPLRLAVAGRLKGGKSTLVNALLGRRVAATEAGECTKVVCWFRYGHQERVEVRLRSGGSRLLALDRHGLIPEDLGVAASEIASVAVWLTNRRMLRDLTIIDTPGLDSLNRQYSDATSQFLSLDEDSQSAVAQADALVYLMPHPGEGDKKHLAAFRTLSRGSEVSVLNAVGVISKADVLGDGRGDPWPAAHKVARNYAVQLRQEVAMVLPVVGLLAETALGDQFTEADAGWLVMLGRAGADEREDMLRSADAFLDYDCAPIGRGQRERLLGMLGLYGIRRGLQLVDDGATGATRLLVELSNSSGIDEMIDVVHRVFTRRADVLKAHTALIALEVLSYRSDEATASAALAGLRRALERARLEPAMRAIQELEVLRAVSTAEVVLPDELRDELVRIVTGGEPWARLGLTTAASVADVGQVALDQAMRWRGFENDLGTSRRQSRVAAVVRESLEDIHLAARVEPANA